MDSCGKLLLSQTKLPSGVHIIDDLWIYPVMDGWVIMMMMGNAPSNKHQTTSWLTFLSFLFPPRLLDFWILWNRSIFLLLLNIVQEAEYVFPGFPEFVFEHRVDWAGWQSARDWGSAHAERCGSWRGLVTSVPGCLARAPHHHRPLQSLTSHWAYLPLPRRYLNLDTQWARVTYLHNARA